MKATLSFDLDNADDREDHAMYIQAPRYLAALNELYSEFRGQAKHLGEYERTNTAIFEKFLSIIHDKGVEL